MSESEPRARFRRLEQIDAALATGELSSTDLQRPTELPSFQEVKAAVAKSPPLEGEFIVRQMMTSPKFFVVMLVVCSILSFIATIIISHRTGTPIDASLIVFSVVFAFPVGVLLSLVGALLFERLLPWVLDTFFQPTDVEAAANRAFIQAHLDYRRRQQAAEDWQWGQTMKPWEGADGPMFERLVARVFRSQGWNVELVGGANDGGVDIRLRNGGLLVLVQCKAVARAVPPTTLRDLYGALIHEKAGGAILVSRFGATEAAKAWIKDKPILVLTAEQLVKAGGLPFDRIAPSP